MQSAQIHMAAWNSLVVAAASTAISVAPRHGRRARDRAPAHVVVAGAGRVFMSPLILPTLAFGLAALMFFSMLGLPLSIPLMVVGHVW